MKTAFDNEKYLKIQKEAILERASHFNKLYLEVGGKLFDDLHASRVLPGFKSDNKIKILESIKDQSEIIIVINSEDIKHRKIRNDFNITYDIEVERLMMVFDRLGLSINSIVFSFYEPNEEVDKFIRKLKKMRINIYKHYKINGYPQNTSLIVSPDGLGKNEYIKTSKKIVIVTAPGPGSGKMATCLSQLYHEHNNGVNAGYAKFETFPVWNLPLSHAVNIAYEAATVDLNDVNMIDPYHLEAYSVSAVNYNRDIDVFPLLKNLITLISGTCLYKSPTDMGVNMIGFAITDDNEVQNAAKAEVVRRFYNAQKDLLLGNVDDNAVTKSQLLMNRLNVDISNRKCVQPALDKAKKAQTPAIAIELQDGRIVTGRRSELLTASAAAILNALKTLAGLPDSIMLLSPSVIEPIQKLKVDTLKNNNPKIHADEILIALAIQAGSNPLADLALKELPSLEHCEAHATCLLSLVELRTLNKMGINVTEEPQSYIYRG